MGSGLWLAVEPSGLCYRVTVADIEKELAELRESQEQGKVTMENSVSEASLYLQDQVSSRRSSATSELAAEGGQPCSLTLAQRPAPCTPWVCAGEVRG
jgi:hypothetical protein